MKHWSPILTAAVVSLALACGDDDSSATSDGSSTTINGTTDGTTTDGTTTINPTTDGTTTNPTTDGPTTDDGTTSPADGTATDSSDGDSGTTDGGSSSEGSSSEGSSSEGSSSDGVMPNCAAGDGPAFNIVNNGFSDYTIDGVNDPGLTVVRGCSYTFTINAPGHPFLIKSVQGPGLLNTYDDGVTNQAVQNGVLSWDVPLGAPNSLFYNCQFHAAMTGTITVIDG